MLRQMHPGQAQQYHQQLMMMRQQQQQQQQNGMAIPNDIARKAMQNRQNA